MKLPYIPKNESVIPEAFVSYAILGGAMLNLWVVCQIDSRFSVLRVFAAAIAGINIGLAIMWPVFSTRAWRRRIAEAAQQQKPLDNPEPPGVGS